VGSARGTLLLDEVAHRGASKISFVADLAIELIDLALSVISGGGWAPARCGPAWWR
jgi:hypothetical protein